MFLLVPAYPGCPGSKAVKRSLLLLLLVLLDLSAAFDRVNHEILLQRLQTSFGVGGTALKCFQSYLTSRTQYVRRSTARSTIVQLICGVPQGSVLGPILFITRSHGSARVL